MTKKEFALQAVKPYYKDPSICGYNRKKQMCCYITEDGRKCVVGQYLKHPEAVSSSISALLSYYSQNDLFIPKVINVLTKREWSLLQAIHDGIACKNEDSIKFYVEQLGLFTMKELEA